MADCFSNSGTWCKGRPFPSATGKRWEGWPTALAIVEHGVKEGQLLQHWRNGGRGWPTALAIVQHGVKEGQLLQQCGNGGRDGRLL